MRSIKRNEKKLINCGENSTVKYNIISTTTTDYRQKRYENILNFFFHVQTSHTQKYWSAAVAAAARIHSIAFIGVGFGFRLVKRAVGCCCFWQAFFFCSLFAALLCFTPGNRCARMIAVAHRALRWKIHVWHGLHIQYRKTSFFLIPFSFFLSRFILAALLRRFRFPSFTFYFFFFVLFCVLWLLLYI